jgi:hypothetical protein
MIGRCTLNCITCMTSVSCLSSRFLESVNAYCVLSPNFHFRAPLTIFQIACILTWLLLSPDFHSHLTSISVCHFTKRAFHASTALIRLPFPCATHDFLDSMLSMRPQLSPEFHFRATLTIFLIVCSPCVHSCMVSRASRTLILQTGQTDERSALSSGDVAGI